MVVNTLVAVGTLGTVVVALFGNYWRRRFFPPKLKVQLCEPAGELTSSRFAEQSKKSWYYHVMVENEHRWSPATNVSLHLVAMDLPGPDNQFIREWNGDVQLKWAFMAFYPAQNRTVGKPIRYDLVSVDEEFSNLALHPIAASTSLKATRQGKCRFAVWLQARSSESDSRIARIEISWDGVWKDNPADMDKHLILKRTQEISKG